MQRSAWRTAVANQQSPALFPRFSSRKPHFSPRMIALLARSEQPGPTENASASAVSGEASRPCWRPAPRKRGSGGGGAALLPADQQRRFTAVAAPSEHARADPVFPSHTPGARVRRLWRKQASDRRRPSACSGVSSERSFFTGVVLGAIVSVVTLFGTAAWPERGWAASSTWVEPTPLTPGRRSVTRRSAASDQLELALMEWIATTPPATAGWPGASLRDSEDSHANGCTGLARHSVPPALGEAEGRVVPSFNRRMLHRCSPAARSQASRGSSRQRPR